MRSTKTIAWNSQGANTADISAVICGSNSNDLGQGWSREQVQTYIGEFWELSSNIELNAASIGDQGK